MHNEVGCAGWHGWDKMRMYDGMKYAQWDEML